MTGTAGVVLSAIGCTIVLAACSGPVDVATPPGADEPACQELLEVLPETVAGEPHRDVQPEQVAAMAWGDPPVVLRCGVREPRALRPGSRCDVINGVGWFAEQRAEAFRFTTLGREVNVEVVVPFDYEPASTALVDVADAVKAAVRRVRPCV